MNKEKIKEVWNKHKKELIVGGCIATGVVIAVMVGKKMKAPSFNIDSGNILTVLCEKDKDTELFVEFCEVCDKVKGNATTYLPITGDEFRELTSEATLRAGDGSLCEVIGGVLFTKVIGKDTEI